MPTTLDNLPLTEAPDQRPETVESTRTANPFASPPTSRASAGFARFEPATNSSLETEHGSDVGPYITPAVAAFLTLTASGSVIVGAAGWADVSPFPLIAAGLFVLFAGLFARVHFGGGRRALLVGMLLLPVLVICAIGAPHLDDGVGDRSYHPTSFDDVKADYRFGIGNLDVDLRDVEFPPGEHVIKIEHGIGAARVQLLAEVSYSATGDVAIGRLDLLGQSDDGFNTTIDAATNDSGAAKIVLEFDTSIGYGSVERD